MTMENPPIAELQRIESLAAELAALAGADIQFALGKAMQVSYKGVARVDARSRLRGRSRMRGHDTGALGRSRAKS